MICNCVNPFNFWCSVDGMKVRYMEYPAKGKNSFRWPNRDDINLYTFDKILCKTHPPKSIQCRTIGLDNFMKASEMDSMIS